MRLLGELAARSEPIDVAGAERYYREALGLADQLGMRPLVARCHLDLAILYDRLGRSEEAGPAFDRAATMFRSMDMTSWLAKVETSRSSLSSA